MKNYHEELIDMKIMDKLFDCIRLVDVEGENLRLEHRINTSLNSVPAFNFEAKREIYHRCMALDTVIYHIEQNTEQILIFIAIPIYIDKKKIVMECITNVTGRLDINALSGQSTHLLNSAYRLSVTDELTGLYNRRYFNQMLPIAVATCAKKEIPLSVIFADLDFFKEVNDSYGHAAGDYLLYEFSIELQRNIRKNTDWVARYGGDEFLLCLIGTNREMATLIAEQIRKNVEQRTFMYHENEIRTTCCLGIYTIYDFQQPLTCEFILKEIDTRLYEAKRAGRNKVMPILCDKGK